MASIIKERFKIKIWPTFVFAVTLLCLRFPIGLRRTVMWIALTFVQSQYLKHISLEVTVCFIW